VVAVVVNAAKVSQTTNKLFTSEFTEAGSVSNQVPAKSTEKQVRISGRRITALANKQNN